MSRITLPDNVLAVLEQQHSKTELCDASGRVVGLFVPPDDAPELPAGELERRRQSNRWHTTAEVLAKLKD
jgi:hypothetical protein